jgi:hypothetical protein
MHASLQAACSSHHSVQQGLVWLSSGGGAAWGEVSRCSPITGHTAVQFSPKQSHLVSLRWSPSQSRQ